jgi:signal transduction histidine kinase
MKIREKLTLQFLGFAAFILLSSSIAIYIFSINYRHEDFYRRMLNKANNTSKLLIEVDEIDANLLLRIEKDNPMSLTNEKIIILNYKNKVLFSTDDQHFIKYDQNLIDEIRLEKEVRFDQDKYEVLGYLFTSKYDRFTVIIAAMDIYGYDKIRNLEKVLLIVDALSLLLLLCAGWIYSGKALKPISRIVEDVNKISASSLDLRLDEGKMKDELEVLAHTFNKMLGNLEIAFKTQKNFISNASHELRTPLMAITGQIEYILMNKRSPEAYESILESIYDDIRSLNTLSNRLLMLAQTNTDIPQTLKINVRIDEILLQAYEELKRSNPLYAAAIYLDESLNDVNMTVLGDEQLLKTAFLNLMENSCKYSDDNFVSIKVSSDNSNDISLEFADHGIGIHGDEIQNIKKPFYRGSNSRKIKGHGIGLSLVDRIVKIHRGSMNISSELGEGTTITLNFPTPRLV